jgi:deoxyribodipyrimidine photo-lyase
MTHLPAPPRRALLWLRDDLRLADNLALQAVQSAQTLLIVFIEEKGSGLRPLGGACRWWRHHALEALQAEIEAKGGTLILLRGAAKVLIPHLAKTLAIECVTWNRRYGAVERALDGEIKAELKAQGIASFSFNGALLREPWEVTTQAGGPMRVFTPFWKAARLLGEPAQPVPAPDRLPSGAALLAELDAAPLALETLNLLPKTPDWSAGLRETWQPGEQGAQKRLDTFLEGPLKNYAENRDRPDQPSTSMLSPHLRFGELSPRQIWHCVEARFAAGDLAASRKDVDKFFAEIGWREFAFHLLYHFPDLAEKNYQPRFDAFPWGKDDSALKAWQQGRTGYPMVDAGMRQLWQTGFMHNRVRMIAASFLIKHLMIDWRQGEQWFWDTLVDADPANNPASWQWVAGSGADAAPYFRIFNPFTQGQKFDPEGDYIRRFVPELATLPTQYIHTPWEAPPVVLAKAKIKLGETYPVRIVAHDAARERALAAFQSLSQP